MSDFYVDIFATKGLEYVLVIVFLTSLVLFWRLLNRPGRAVRGSAPAGAQGQPTVEWFALADDRYYHQGHSWVRPDGETMALVGVDDFAQRLLGLADEILVPGPGTQVKQGEKAWKLRFGTRYLDLLSPVEGEIVEVNEKVLRSPHLLNEDPYGEGWVARVRSSRLGANLKNLMKGRLAGWWMQEAVRSLREVMSTNPTPVLQDGGVPVSGLAKAISADHWEEIAQEFLLVS